MKQLLYLFTIVSFSFTQVSVSGETSTDISTSGGDDTFSSMYTRVTLSTDEKNWNITTNLDSGNINIEEAWYTYNAPLNITFTLGIQPEAYGNAWTLHRPGSNVFLNAPREHGTINGVGISASAYIVDIKATVGSEDYWAVRASNTTNRFGMDILAGFSTSSESSKLIDATIKGKGFTTSLEYDLSEETSGEYWVRSVINPGAAKGAFATIGYTSEEDILYGVGYSISKIAFITSELSGDDIRIRVSYSFK